MQRFHTGLFFKCLFGHSARSLIITLPMDLPKDVTRFYWLEYITQIVKPITTKWQRLFDMECVLQILVKGI